MSLPPFACVGGLWATRLVDVCTDPGELRGRGRWVAVLPYAGRPQFLRFAHWSAERPGELVDLWSGPHRMSWSSSLSEQAYCGAVESTQQAIARGDVYQANICRVMTAESRVSESLLGLFDRVSTGNPSPFSAIVHAPEFGLEIVSASPELFLRREGRTLTSGPIKGTGRTQSDLLDKDAAENVMIVDLVRNDLSRVCVAGTVDVPRLLSIEQHPGLVHLVSEVSGTLREGIDWPQILDATFPPGSVTGAPKSSALALIDELEVVSRDVYCGALGWINAEDDKAELAVTIRTFWRREGKLHFGTGAGITWGSESAAEWRETELKAQRLIDLASEGAR